MNSNTTTTILRLTIAKRIKLLNTFSQTLHELTHLPVSVWLPDRERKLLRIIAFVKLPASFRDKAVIHLDEPNVIGEVFKKQQTEIVREVRLDERWKHQQEASEQGWTSILCAPIIVNGQSEGVVTLYASENRQNFLDSLKTLIESFANQIALTFEVEDRRVVLEALMHISEKYETVSENLKDILQGIVKASCEVLGADCAVLYPFDAERDMYYDKEHVASYGLRQELGLQEKPRVRWSMATQVRNEGELVINDLAAQFPERLQDHFIVREEVRAFMAIAPRANNVALGLLFLNYRSPHTFTEGEKNSIRLFAHQAGIAIHNTWLYKQSQRQAQALRELHEIGSGLLAIPSKRRKLKEVLDEVARTAHKVLKADLVDLYNYNEEEDRFLLPPSLAGERNSPIPKVIHQDDVIYRLFSSREPLYITDSQQDRRTNTPFTPNRPADTTTQLRFVVRERIKSTAAIPLIVDDKTVGALFINYRTPQTFSDRQKELINVFAAEAAIAIANVSLYESSQKRAEALSRLNSVAENLIQLSEGTTELPELLKQIADGAREVLEADLIDLYQYQQSLDHYPMPIIEAGERFQPVKKDKIYRNDTAVMVVEAGHAWYVDDVLNEPNLTRPHEQRPPDQVRERFVVREKIQSLVTVPLKIGNEIMGVLFASYRQKQSFSKPQRELIELFATQTAIAIRNARLVIRRKALLEFGNQLAAQVNLTESDVLNLVHAQTTAIMDTRNLYIALYDGGSDEVRFGLVYTDGSKIDVKNDLRWGARKAGYGKAEEIIRTRKPLFFATRAASESWRQTPGRKTSSELIPPSWIGVPMIAGERVLGVIATHHERENTFTLDDLSVLQTIANQAATALENVRLYTEARHEVLAERQLATLGRALAAIEHRINNTLNIIAPNLSRLRSRVDPEDEEIKEILGIIERNTHHTTMLLDRIRAPLREASYGEVDVNAVLNEIFLKQRREWTADRTHWLVEASLETCPDPTLARLPLGQISEVFDNLIQNAYRELDKAHRARHLAKDQGQEPTAFTGAKLQVWSAIEEGKIKVRVKDNVPGGIPPKIQPRLFTRPVSSQIQGEGSGLGLWLSKMIMESIGGDLRIETTGLLGTTMLVEIPLQGRKE